MGEGQCAFLIARHCFGLAPPFGRILPIVAKPSDFGFANSGPTYHTAYRVQSGWLRLLYPAREIPACARSFSCCHCRKYVPKNRFRVGFLAVKQPSQVSHTLPVCSSFYFSEEKKNIFHAIETVFVDAHVSSSLFFSAAKRQMLMPVIYHHFDDHFRYSIRIRRNHVWFILANFSAIQNATLLLNFAAFVKSDFTTRCGMKFYR